MGALVTIALLTIQYAQHSQTTLIRYFQHNFCCNLNHCLQLIPSQTFNYRFTMIRFILFFWSLTLAVPLHSAPVPRSVYLNVNNNSSSTSPIGRVLETAGSGDSAMNVAIVAILSTILLACLVVVLFVKTTNKIRELSKMLARNDLESGSQVQEDAEVQRLPSQIDFKPKRLYEQLMMLKLENRQKEQPRQPPQLKTSMEKVAQRKRRKRTLKSRSERNKQTTMKVRHFGY